MIEENKRIIKLVTGLLAMGIAGIMIFRTLDTEIISPSLRTAIVILMGLGVVIWIRGFK